MTVIKTQIDKLGERLRTGQPTEADLRELDEYRRSFRTAYERTVGVMRDVLSLEPTGRPARSTPSIVEKLRRESIRLSQMQDIAGCRIVLVDSPQQRETVAAIAALFEGASIIDRRKIPSHGYRAVHIVATIAGKPIEMQTDGATARMGRAVGEVLRRN